jgi:hypothetical protein
MRDKPLPPEVLADALQDRIHPTSGRLLRATPIDVKAIRARITARIGESRIMYEGDRDELALCERVEALEAQLAAAERGDATYAAAVAVDTRLDESQARVKALEAAIMQALALLANSGDAGSLAVIALREALGVEVGP